MQLVNSTITDVEAKEDVTYAALLGILDRWIAKRIDWDSLEPFATLGIDEIALLKGHRDFVAVISAQTESGDLHVLAVLPDRLKATVLAWLLSMPDAMLYGQKSADALPMQTMTRVQQADPRFFQGWRSVRTAERQCGIQLLRDDPTPTMSVVPVKRIAAIRAAICRSSKRELLKRMCSPV